METSKKEALVAAGINCDAALERFMGSEAMLNRFLKKFLADENYGKLTEAAESGAAGDMLAASHTLKGICGNLAFETLFDLFTRQVQTLRDGDTQAAVDMMPEITEEYGKVTEAIRANCE